MYREFNGPITVEDLPDPAVPDDGVVIEVRASGLCRSDLFAWHGHDPGTGNAEVAANSVRCLRKQGRHVQAGLLAARATALPLSTIIVKELEVLGTKGMSARRYPKLMDLIARTGMDLGLLVSRTMDLDDLPDAFETMAGFGASGVAVVNEF